MALTFASNIENLRKQLADCHSVLNIYKWLTDSFVLVRSYMQRIHYPMNVGLH